MHPLNSPQGPPASDSLDASCFVEAAAGSGKTTRLIERVTGLLGRGIPPRNIVAITFTRAAAAELRDRVCAALESRGAARRGAPADLEQMAVQTIDSFALSLLRERPLEAGLPPLIELLDEARAPASFDREWDAWLRAELALPAFQAEVETAVTLGLVSPVAALRSLAEEMHKRYELLEICQFPAPPPVELLAADSAVSDTPRIRALLERCRNETDKLYVHVSQTVLPFLERLRESSSDSAGAMALMAATGKVSGGKRTGNRTNWVALAGGKSAIEELRATLADMQDRMDRELADSRAFLLAALLRRVARFVTAYAETRRRTGQLEFRDLLVLSLRLLRPGSAALRDFRARYTHLLIDEIQDSDPLQIEIALRLTRRSPGQDRHRGVLYVVGDPKQSIYRFRNADVSALTPLQESMPHTTLSKNFRSHPAILEWVNTAIGGWMTQTAGPHQAAYIPLEAGVEHPEPPHGPAFGVHRIGRTIDGASQDQVREAEAREVARIAREVSGGLWTVFPKQREGSPRVPRRSAAGDLCILLPTRTGLEQLERALEDEGVTYTLEGQSFVFSRQDVRDLINCLTAIDDPTDQVAVVAALRSSIFGCTDTDLFDWRAAGRTFDYDRDGENSAPAPMSPVGAAFDSLRRFRAFAASASVPALIEHVVWDRRLRELARMRRNDAERLRRLELITELARQSAGDSGGTLRAFIRWAEDQRMERVRMAESPVASGQPDAVRIMTIHGAKGLEFPVVIIAGMGMKQHRPGPVLFSGGQPGAGRISVEARVGSNEDGRFESAGYAQISEEDKRAEEAEFVRLMYVAATRAQDHLVFSTYAKPGDKTAAAVVSGFLGGRDALWPELQAVVAVPAEAGRAQTGLPVAVPGPFDPEAWSKRRTESVTRAAASRSVTATSIKPQGAPAVAKDAPAEREEAPWLRGRAAGALGRAVHAVLQDADLSNDSDLASLAERHARNHGVTEQTAVVLRLAEAAFASAVVRRAASAMTRGRCWREVPVSVPLPDAAESGPHVLEGIIDLIFEEDSGGLVIVDYKTDRVGRSESLEAAAGPYIPQLGAYAFAVEQVTGQAVTEAVMVFAERAAAGEGGEYRIPDLGAAKRQASHLAAQS
jgi:ATP-dependent exoDNAse (exonuclease V) beta subunit